MQAVQTKFLGPTNTLGSRIKATCWRTSVTVAWDYGLSVEQNHNAAIDKLVEKLNDERINDKNSYLWQVVATGESVDGKGKTAIIDIK